MIAQDSAKFWLPKLLTDPWLTTLVPKTVFVDYNEEEIEPSLHGEDTVAYEKLWYAVHDALRTEIGYPAFIRTDVTSAKHAGKCAWYIQHEDSINTALISTLTLSHTKTYFQKLKASAIMVRPFLQLKHERTAFNGLPVAKEWRIFSDGTRYQCAHYYWPEEALAGHMDDGGSADALVHWSNSWLPSEALDAAERAAKLMEGGKWSIDFAEGEDGKLWLLDMATAGNSYHAPMCQYAGLDKENKL